MRWNVYRYNCNKDKIEAYDIFEHGYFVEYANKAYKKCQSKDEFAKQLEKELRYYFWSRAEHELVIEITEDNHIFLIPWCGCRNPEEVKIDVTDEANFDWKGFAKLHTERQIYGNKAKIDVFDQVMFKWDKFVDYVWRNVENGIKR